MKIVIVSDAWYPQVNGVVRTLERTVSELNTMGHETHVVSPQPFYTVPCPTYPEIRLSLTTATAVGGEIAKHNPDHIHIATEATLGRAARSYCQSNGRPFTTSYHTRFPEYLSARFPIPISWTYAYLRNFHNSGNGCMVATPSLRHNLAAQGFTKLVPWTRGVDSELFHPDKRVDLGFEGPVQLYVGRVAVEKNIEAFLETSVGGTKVVVGDGPARDELEAKYPDVKFVGTKFGDELARYYASADVFVFPSKTDTFGIVMLEALASGVPVAGYPVMGPVDVIGHDKTVGRLSENLGEAIEQALRCDPAVCRSFAEERSWRTVAEMFLENVEAIYKIKEPRVKRDAMVSLSSERV
ncbi:MAG: glycosyltransferase family 1 protein [Hyphomicrobiales bacterium]